MDELGLPLVDRREYLCKQYKRNPCPKCGTLQVQITVWYPNEEWKCRECKHKWETNFIEENNNANN